MSAATRRTVVLDAGALIALERRNREMLADLAVIMRECIPTLVPAGVVAQVWRGHPRQHHLHRLLAAHCVRIDELDYGTARAIGALIGKAGTSDVTDGHVALLARRTAALVYTSDPSDLAAIDPAIDLQPV